MPQASSGKFAGSGAKLGCGINLPIGIPSLLRATQRCEWPRRSSTRTSRIGFIARLTGSGIEDGMCRIRPILGREDRIGGIAMKQLDVQTGNLRFSTHALFLLR